MKRKTKPCKLCVKKRYGNSSWCRTHYFERKRLKREEKKQRRLNSKTYQESLRKGLRRKLDIVFSKLIRARGHCEKCGKTLNEVQLQCSHIFTRSNLAVRWDELNANCLCFFHHLKWWHAEPAEAVEWLKCYYGEEKMTELKRRANLIKQWTVPELQSLYEDLKERISKLNA